MLNVFFKHCLFDPPPRPFFRRPRRRHAGDTHIKSKVACECCPPFAICRHSTFRPMTARLCTACGLRLEEPAFIKREWRGVTGAGSRCCKQCKVTARPVGVFLSPAQPPTQAHEPERVAAPPVPAPMLAAEPPTTMNAHLMELQHELDESRAEVRSLHPSQPNPQPKSHLCSNEATMTDQRCVCVSLRRHGSERVSPS